jgi:hypothetical protein
MDFAAGVYQSLYTGDSLQYILRTVSHVSIFNTALRYVAPLPLSLVQLSPSPLPLIGTCTHTVCAGGE